MVTEKHAREIRVEAYHRTGKATERTRVHVHNYDQISGSGSGSSPTALTLTYEIPVPPLAKRIAVACAKQLRGLVRVIPSKVFEDKGVLEGKEDDFKALMKAIQDAADSLERSTANPQHGAPPSAMVFLKNLAVRHDDELLIRVIIKSETKPAEAAVPSSGSVPAKAAKPAEYATYSEDYHIRLVKVGLMNTTRGSFIYARASSGGAFAKSWKPNAAALTEWHYRPLYAKTMVGKIWSWLDPGAGVHLASLDMDPVLSTEVGIGVNLSLWGGLLQGGYGTNLLIDRDHEYYFIGLDLFALLQTQRDSEAPIR